MAPSELSVVVPVVGPVVVPVVPVVELQVVAFQVVARSVQLQREEVVKVLRSDGSIVELVASPGTSSVLATTGTDRHPDASSKASTHRHLVAGKSEGNTVQLVLANYRAEVLRLDPDVQLPYPCSARVQVALLMAGSQFASSWAVDQIGEYADPCVGCVPASGEDPPHAVVAFVVHGIVVQWLAVESILDAL